MGPAWGLHGASPRRQRLGRALADGCFPLVLRDLAGQRKKNSRVRRATDPGIYGDGWDGQYSSGSGPMRSR